MDGWSCGLGDTERACACACLLGCMSLTWLYASGSPPSLIFYSPSQGVGGSGSIHGLEHTKLQPRDAGSPRHQPFGTLILVRLCNYLLSYHDRRLTYLAACTMGFPHGKIAAAISPALDQNPDPLEVFLWSRRGKGGKPVGGIADRIQCLNGWGTFETHWRGLVLLVPYQTGRAEPSSWWKFFAWMSTFVAVRCNTYSGRDISFFQRWPVCSASNRHVVGINWTSRNMCKCLKQIREAFLTDDVLVTSIITCHS